MKKEIETLIKCKTKIKEIDLHVNVCDNTSGNVVIKYETAHNNDCWVSHSIRFYLPDELRETIFSVIGEKLKEALKSGIK